MNIEENAGTTGLLQQLRTVSDGLLFMSETEHPFEVVHLPDVQDNSTLPAALAQLSAMTEEERVETVELPYFFRNMTSAETGAGEEENNTARRFRELQAFIEQNLQEVRVYRLGKRRIQAYILGKTATGDYAGLKTELVET